MAVDYGILERTPSIASRFMAGRQEAAAEQDRNMLRQMQMEQMGAQRENILAQREQRMAQAEERRSLEARRQQAQEAMARFSDTFAKAGYKFDRTTLGDMFNVGRETGNESLLKTAIEGLKTLDEQEAYDREMAQFRGAPANAMAPSAEGAAPAPVNALAQPGVNREMAQRMIMSPNPRIREQGKALLGALPPPPKEFAPSADMQGYELARRQGYTGTFFDFMRQLAEAKRPPAQPREPAAPTVTQIQDPTNPNQMLTVDARRYQGGGLGSSGVIGTSGKPAPIAAAELKREEGKTQLQTDLDNLRSAFTELNRRRAIPSTERGGISNLASSAQASGLGQAAGRAFGTKEQVERDVINSARQRLVASIKNATGMSSKSLDSNLELQTMLRSLSDPSQAFETAIRIIDDIEDIYVRGAGAKNEPSTPRPPAPGASSGQWSVVKKP
jgi:hypothetical protein